MKLHQLAVATAVMLSLTACDNSDAQWAVQRGKCISTSSNGKYVAMIAPRNAGFLSLEPGCPDNMGLLGLRPTTIKIDGDRYPAIQICNAATQYHETFSLGKMVQNAPSAGYEWALKASKAFSGFFGADVNLGDGKAHFGRGNFTEACKDYIPHKNNTHKSTTHKGWLGSLFGQRKKDEPQANAGKEKILAAPDEASPVSELHAHDTNIKLKEGDFQKGGVIAGVNAGSYGGDSADSSARDGTLNRQPAPDENSNHQPAQVTATPTSPAPQTTAQSDAVTTTPGREQAVIDNACVLKNGKQAVVFATPGQPYRYSFENGKGKAELQLQEGVSGVTAHHYYMLGASWSVTYVRFSKGTYDYVLMSKFSREGDTQALRVYHNNKLLMNARCENNFEIDASQFPHDAHFDSDEKSDFFTRF